jgi:hypothetical protein
VIETFFVPGIPLQLKPPEVVLSKQRTTDIPPIPLHIVDSRFGCALFPSHMRPACLRDPHWSLTCLVLNMRQGRPKAVVCLVDSVLIPKRVRTHTCKVDPLVQSLLSDIHMADWLVLQKLSVCRIGYVLSHEGDVSPYLLRRGIFAIDILAPY